MNPPPQPAQEKAKKPRAQWSSAEIKCFLTFIANIEDVNARPNRQAGVDAWKHCATFLKTKGLILI